MSLWKVDIEKLLLGEYWTNRYFVEAASLAAAVIIGEDIYTAERGAHTNVVLFTKVRVSDIDPGTDVYQVTPKSTLGLRGDVGSWLPLFNVVRVDFTTAGGGRPSRKYLRTPILEQEQTNGMLETGYRTVILNQYVVPLLAIPGFVDVDGQSFVSGAVFAEVGMRQLRRGSKRRLEPVIPDPPA